MFIVVPAPGTRPGLRDPAGARVQRPLVEADEQHPRVVDERRLGAVAVVGVVVEDPHPLARRRRATAATTAMLETRQKPIESVGVAWWPGGRTAQNAAVPRPSRSASTAVSPAPAARWAAVAECVLEAGVGVDPAAAGRGHRLEPVEVPRGVDALEVGARGGHRLERDQRRRRAPRRCAPAMTACSRDGRSG